MNRPKVKRHLRFYYNAFWALNGDRQLGANGGCGQISFIAIDAYADRKRIDSGDEFDRFEKMIRHMDSAYMSEISSRMKRDAKGR